MTNLQTLVFYATPEHECSYLPGKKATTMFVDPKARINTELYTQLSQLGFRRSGNHFYRPHCNQCNACIPVRTEVEHFKPSRSQRRVWNRNRNVQWQIMPADFHEDHYLLYEKYVCKRHADGDMYPPSREQYRSFLADGQSCTKFVEFTLDGKLYGVAVIDELLDGLSAIYTFFDPELDWYSPGTFAILWQIHHARAQGKPFVYLGYYIRQCAKMAYKCNFKPYQVRIEEQWLSEPELKAIMSQHQKSIP